MKREFLKGLNLEDNIIEQIMGEYGKSTQKLNDSINNITGQFNQTKKALEELEPKVKSNEELTIKLEEIKKANQDLETKYLNREKEYVLNDILAKSGAKNKKALLGLLDITKYEFKEGKYEDIEKDIEELKKTDSYLFNIENENKDLGISLIGTNSAGKELTGVEKMFYQSNPKLEPK